LKGSKNMRELTNFEGIQVKIVQDENGNPLFEAYSTGMALGYIKYAKDRPYPKKDRVDKIITNAEITPVVRSGQLFLSESQLYDFMLEARTDKCRKFRKWITNEVLPSIRKTGSYLNSTTSPVPYSDYKYIDKTYHTIPVLTIADICHLLTISYMTLYQFVKSKLSANTDFTLLQGKSLMDYLSENPDVPRCRKSLYVIYYSGIRQIVDYYKLEINLIPKIMTETRGYVINQSIISLMESVRKELKGIEALTYLLESNDTPINLENYRRILTSKLAAVSWWKVDVETAQLGIHKGKFKELESIKIGERGVKY
jgi:prophage antirepressor-like protein